MGLQGRALPERLAVLVKIEARSLEVLHDPVVRVLAGRRVLIVDDEVAIGNMLAACCDMWGLEPVVATGPSEALDIAHRTRQSTAEGSWCAAQESAARPEGATVEFIREGLPDRLSSRARDVGRAATERKKLRRREGAVSPATFPPPGTG